jgi:hypothetical protein
MNGKFIAALMLLLCLVWTQSAIASELGVKSGDNIQKVLEENKGKRVTVRVQGNDELTGKVKTVTKELLHLGELSGRDFFDAVIDLNRISVVIIRVKE